MVGVHDATRLTTPRDSAMPGPLSPHTQTQSFSLKGGSSPTKQPQRAVSARKHGRSIRTTAVLLRPSSLMEGIKFVSKDEIDEAKKRKKEAEAARAAKEDAERKTRRAERKAVSMPREQSGARTHADTRAARCKRPHALTRARTPRPHRPRQVVRVEPWI
jgi:multidrug resistance efflux pump